MRLFHAVKNYVDSADFKGVDPTYLDLPEYGFLAYTNLSLTGTHLRLRYELPYASQSRVNLTGSLNTRLASLHTLGLSYRGWGLSYSTDYSSYGDTEWSFCSYGQARGFEIRIHNSNTLSGELEHQVNDAYQSPFNVDVYGVHQHTVLVNYYHVFNHDRFSLPAAMSHTVIQKRSAGSFLACVNFHRVSSTIDDMRLSYTLGQEYLPEGTSVRSQFRKLMQEQISLGGGYAYNYALPDLHLLLHGSFMPMLSVWHKNYTYYNISGIDANGLPFDNYQHKQSIGQRPVSVNASIHGSVVYNYGRFLSGIVGLMNIDSLPGSDRFSLYTFNWSAKLFFGVRF